MSITTTELMEGVKLHKIDTKKYKLSKLLNDSLQTYHF